MTSLFHALYREASKLDVTPALLALLEVCAGGDVTMGQMAKRMGQSTVAATGTVKHTAKHLTKES